MSTPKLSKPLKEAFKTFLEYAPAARLNRNLRKMLTAWLLSGNECALYYEDLLIDLEWLFELLDVAEEEYQNPITYKVNTAIKPKGSQL